MEILRTLEERLLDPAVRQDRAQVDALLDDEFREFGKSGRAFDKAEILDLLQQEAELRYTLALEDFAAATLAEGVVLVTYRSVWTDLESGEVVRARRSSIWILRADGWKMRFHQGTPIP